MQIQVLAAFIISWALVASEASENLMAPSWQTATALAAYLFGAAGIAAANTALGLRGLTRMGATLPRTLMRHNLLAMATAVWLTLGLAGVIYLGYGRWLMDDLGLTRLPLAGPLAAVGPFIVAMLVVWTMDYPFYRLARRRILAARLTDEARRPWTLGQYIAYNCRHRLLFIAVPVGLIMLSYDLLCLYAWPYLAPLSAGEDIMLAASAGAAAGVFLIAPALIVRIWRTERMDDKPLRRGLEEISHRLKLRFREILTWKSEGMIANAGVMGIWGRIRYVLLSDGLLENLDHRQVEAIFAHEAGHIASHHILYSAMFTVASAAICAWGARMLSQAAELDYLGEVAAALGLISLVWFVGFGRISRLFERQSDVISAWSAGRQGGADPPDNDPDSQGRITPEGAAAFARALDSIARLNGIPARQRSWRHGSVAGRISYILYLSSTGGSRKGIDRAVRRVKLLIWVLVICAIALTAAWRLAQPAQV